MISDKTNNSRTTRQQAAAATGEPLRSAPRLRAVPDLPAAEGGAAERPYIYEPLDVIGIDRKRAEYRAARPDISDEELEEYVNLCKSHLSPATVASYERALEPFYRIAEEDGFHPLKCQASHIEAYLLHLMTSGKRGADGERDPDSLYSKSYFKKFLAALRAAAAAQGLPSPTDNVDIGRLTRGYARHFGSNLPDEAKVEILFDQFAEIERRER